MKLQLEQEIASRLPNKIDELLNSLKEATPVDTGNARDGWTIEKNSIVNHVEYIDELNGGSSKQAPSHFIERTLLSKDGVRPNGVIVKND